MSLPLMKLSVLASLTLVPVLLQAQGVSAVRPAQLNGFDFTIQNIMRGPEIYGRQPSSVQWSADGRWIHFMWNTPGTSWREPLRPFRVRAEPGARPEQLTSAQADSAAPYIADGPRSPDRGSRLVEANGDLWVISLRGAPHVRLTQTVAVESRPTWSADGRTVHFMRDGNAFSMRLADGATRQLTDIRTGPAPVDSARGIGQRGVLETQQRELFEVIRDRTAADSVALAERKAREAAGLQRVYVAATERVTAIDVSPDGRAALVVVSQPATATRQAEVPQFVTTTGYVENLRTRTKVGDALGKQRVLWVQLPSGRATPLRLFADSAGGRVAIAGWNADGSRAALFAFSDDNKSRRLMVVGSDTTSLRVVETLRDSAWVGGPCSSCAGWYDGGRKLWFVSEATGYSHLYATGLAAGAPSAPVALTSGRWEVLEVALSPDEREFFLATSEPSPFERQQYRMSVDGGSRTRVTSQSGGHAAVPSPDGRWLADVASFVNRPPELFLLPNAPGTGQHQLTTSPTAEFLRAEWLAPAIAQIPGSDGISIPGHIYRPEDMGARPNGAAVIFVHGAGSCTTSATSGRSIRASTSSTSTSRRRVTSSSTWITVHRLAMDATGEPPSIAGWAAATCRTTSMPPAGSRAPTAFPDRASASTAAATVASSR